LSSPLLFFFSRSDIQDGGVRRKYFQIGPKLYMKMTIL